MDWDSLGPLGVFLSTLAGGVVWVMNRIDKAKRARRDDALKAADERLAEKDKDLQERDAKIALLEEELRAANTERHSYYWQLKDNGIEPVPGWREARYV
ncbi:hypothetical protein [Brachybacterium sp. NPDC056505]|uniref:hypothetical protein n=1 Tax=Brachybacterium sp. NPDC056505 TaxID=3345843 RepID=UPI003670B5BF